MLQQKKDPVTDSNDSTTAPPGISIYEWWKVSSTNLHRWPNCLPTYPRDSRRTSRTIQNRLMGEDSQAMDTIPKTCKTVKASDCSAVAQGYRYYVRLPLGFGECCMPGRWNLDMILSGCKGRKMRKCMLLKIPQVWLNDVNLNAKLIYVDSESLNADTTLSFRFRPSLFIAQVMWGWKQRWPPLNLNPSRLLGFGKNMSTELTEAA